MRKILLIGIACIGLAILVFIDRWQTNSWHVEKQSELQATATLFQTRLENSITSRFNALAALTALFVMHPETTADEFSVFAEMLMRANPPIRALQHADDKTRVSYVYPPKNNAITVAKPMVLLSDPKRSPYVKRAIAQKKPSIQGPFPLRQGGTGLVVRSPMFAQEQFMGLAIGVYDVPVLIKEALAGITLNHVAFRLLDDQQKIFYESEEIAGELLERSVSVADSSWTIILGWISPVHPPVFKRMLIWFLGGGFLLSILILIHFSWTQAQSLELIVKERTDELYSTNQLLTDEIVDRKQVEIELRESEEIFRTLVTNSEDIVTLIDKNGHFVLSEGKGLSVLGLQPGQVVGESVCELYKGYPNMLADMRKTFAGETVNTEITIENIPFESCFVPWRDHKGEIIGLLGWFLDITERKHSECELEKHRQQLQKLVDERTEELAVKVTELEEMNDVFVGREFRIKALKDKLSEFESK